MSDGKITKICDCRIKAARVASLSNAEQALLARVIDDKKIDAADAKRAGELGQSWTNSALACAGLK